jgi:glycosyltransferase involved in cell wall biosynthesis
MPAPAILVILPALNESQNLPKTLAQIRQHVPNADIVVVNDGSIDSTPEVAKAAGAFVLNLPYNVGIGAAVQTGFKFADAYGYDIVVRNDGDGQHSPEGITQLLDALQQGDVDMVVGSRFIGSGDYGTSPARRTGIFIISRLLSVITAQSITDPTSGFSAFNRRAIKLFARVYPHDYPEPEAIILLHRSGLKMCEIPVNFLPRGHGKSSITALRSVYYMVKVILAILINLLRRAPAIEGA